MTLGPNTAENEFSAVFFIASLSFKEAYPVSFSAAGGITTASTIPEVSALTEVGWLCTCYDQEQANTGFLFSFTLLF